MADYGVQSGAPGLVAPANRHIRGRRMDFDDYLRSEAAKFRQLAEESNDELIKRELLDLAAVCEEVANRIEDRMTAG